MQGHACGLLATSSDLELGLLQDCFELDGYDYLVKVRRCADQKRVALADGTKDMEQTGFVQDLGGAIAIRISQLWVQDLGSRTS